MIHVAVDAQNLVRDHRGIGRYARAVLTRALGCAEFRWTLVVHELFPRSSRFSQLLGGQRVMTARRVPDDADVVWSPWNGTFLELRNVPAVATVHDCTPFAFPVADGRQRAREQGPFVRTARTARTILVQSRYTAGEVERWLGVDPERIVVTPLAAEAIFTPGAPATLPAGLQRRGYILVVGSPDQRKNWPTLCAAYERAFPGGAISLVFTRRPAALPAGAVVVDAPEDADLLALYRGAMMLALPSVSEGFGLPLIEAMACGTPVLAARAGALPDVGGDAVCWIDDPLDVDAWTQTMRRLAADDAARSALAERGPTQAARFSWERCTAQTLDALRAAAAR
jgi:glycosyltransferase involved in cell wall biosynthesis